MRIASMPVVFVWLVFSGSASAQAEAQATQTATLANEGKAPDRAVETNTLSLPANRKIEAGLALLSMPFGKGNGYLDLAFTYGVGLSFNRAVWRGLSLGVAPQVLFNIKHDANAPASIQYDLMARIAYAFRLTAAISAYGEILPGYSIISHPTGDRATGSVLAYGVGGTMDVTNQGFVTLGVGYQHGFQSIAVNGQDYWHRDQFWRLALGAGWRI